MTDYKFRNNKYNTRNYVEVLEKLTPGFYIDEETSVSGLEQDPLQKISHSLIAIANKSQDIFGLSSFPTSQITRDIANPSSFAMYFVKQNKMTEFDIVDFDTEILAPLGYYLNDFNTSAEFSSFLSETLLPTIRSGDPTLQAKTGGVYADSLQGTQDHLLAKMGWFYILNIETPAGYAYSPATYVHDKLVDTVYQGDKLTTYDGVVGAINYIWRNLEEEPSFQGILPSEFNAGPITNTWTSGTQQLEKLETLLGILISDKGLDDNDTSLRSTFDDYYIYNSSSFTVEETPKGPFYKFLRAMSWSVADTTNQVNMLSDLYNPDTCTDEMIIRAADILGLELFGYNPDRWRLQVKNAVGMYRKSGTLAGLKAGIDSIYGPDAFDVSSKLVELYESYVPDLMLYSLLTESPYFRGVGENYDRQTAWRSGVKNYSTSGLEENARIAVDYMLAELYLSHQEYFMIGAKTKFEPYRFETLVKNGLDPQHQTSAVYSFIHAPLTKAYTFLPLPLRDQTTAGENMALIYSQALTWGYSHDDIYGAAQDGPDGYGIYVMGAFYVGGTYGGGTSEGGLGGVGGTGGDDNPDFPGGEKFLLGVTGRTDFVFNYRSHENGFPLPPFERRSYYSNNDLDIAFINTMVALLHVFEVPTSFTSLLSDYVEDQALASVDTSGVEKAFSRTLFFTSEKHYPPNYEDTLGLPSDKVKYFSLWNSKSSHFILDLKSQSFDFADRGITSDGAQAPANVGRITKEISPAKAIPLVVLDASVIDLEFFGSSDFPYNDNAMEDGVLTDSVTQGRNFSRSFRSAGYHTRDGFNMPISYQPSSAEGSLPSALGFVPLGRLPGGDAYFPIRNRQQLHNLPNVWRTSSTVDSDVVYQGNSLANTFPCRGLSAIGSDAKNLDLSPIHDKYQDRGELQEIMGVMHKIWDRIAAKKAEFYVRDTLSNVSALDSYAWNIRSRWQRVAESYANSAIHTESFPGQSVSAVDFDNFEFDAKILEVYNHYASVFGSHDLGRIILTKANAGIFSQTYGPLLYNADLSIAGSAVAKNSYLQASEFKADKVFRIEKNSGSGVFSVSGTTNWQTELVLGTEPTKMPVPISGTLNPATAENTLSEVKEFRNAVFCSGVQLIDGSGSSELNNFQLFNKPKSLISSNQKGRYAAGNTIIKAKATNGLPRIKFDLKNFGNLTDGNKLIPEHKFHLAVSALIAEESGRTLGGGSIGVWIHTGPIANSAGDTFFWSWVNANPAIPDQESGTWFPTRLNELSKEAVLVGTPTFAQPLATIFNIDEVLLSETNEGSLIPYAGASGYGPAGATDYPNSLGLIERSFFESLVVNFDTNEGNVVGSNLVSDPIHTTDRDYYVEVMFVPRPSNETKYMLFDQIFMRDNTLWKSAAMSAGVPENPTMPFIEGVNESVVRLTKAELWTIIRYLKQNTEGMNANLTRNQTTRSRGLWVHPLVTTNHGDGHPLSTTFLN